ncbi:MAG: 50S ribosomal protein L19 [Candidatus Magasanikbacteria bacterium]|nr:50S ribosomal protein L19 [Candidatus Magasanikbacteria bacterium]
MTEDIRENLKPGMIVRVHQKIKELNTKGEEKERVQIFEGTVIAVKHGNEACATVTVRKISEGVGVEKIYPIHSPVVVKIELVRQMKVGRSKAYFLRGYKKRLKEVKVGEKTEVATPKTEERK